MSRRECTDCDGIDLNTIFIDKGNGKCSNCHGKGWTYDLLDSFVDTVTFSQDQHEKPCDVCYKTGECQTCGGNGLVYENTNEEDYKSDNDEADSRNNSDSDYSSHSTTSHKDIDYTSYSSPSDYSTNTGNSGSNDSLFTIAIILSFIIIFAGILGINFVCNRVSNSFTRSAPQQQYQPPAPITAPVYTDPSTYPNEEKIKSDLIGKNIGVWRFESLNDFTSIKILFNKDKTYDNNLYRIIAVGLQKGFPTDYYLDTIEVWYIYQDNGWQLHYPQPLTPLKDVTPSRYMSQYSSGDNEKIRIISDSENNTIPSSNEPQAADNSDDWVSPVSTNSFTEIHNDVVGDYLYNTNTKVYSHITGLCSIAQKIRYEIYGVIDGNVLLQSYSTCVLNGRVNGDITLQTNALLVMDGTVNGHIYNYGGRVVTHNSVNGETTRRNVVPSNGKVILSPQTGNNIRIVKLLPQIKRRRKSKQ